MKNVRVLHKDFYGEVIGIDKVNDTVAIDLPWGTRRWFYPDDMVECTSEEVQAFNEGYPTHSPQEIFDGLNRLQKRGIQITDEILKAFRVGHFCTSSNY